MLRVLAIIVLCACSVPTKRDGTGEQQRTPQGVAAGHSSTMEWAGMAMIAVGGAMLVLELRKRMAGPVYKVRRRRRR